MMVEDAAALEKAGCFCVVLEGIPSDLARRITEKVSIPTIGIGAGIDCDGQVLVLNDMLGIHDRPLPRFVKVYDALGDRIRNAVGEYVEEVKTGKFPSMEHTYVFPKKKDGSASGDDDNN